MPWVPPFREREHCDGCADGWVGQTLCPRLLREQRTLAQEERERIRRLKRTVIEWRAWTWTDPAQRKDKAS